jgi:hypothetical protein
MLRGFGFDKSTGTAWQKIRTQLCVLRFVLPLVRPPFDALLTFLTLAIDASFRHGIFDTAVARTRLITAFAGCGAIGTLGGECEEGM